MYITLITNTYNYYTVTRDKWIHGFDEASIFEYSDFYPKSEDNTHIYEGVLCAIIN